MQDTTLTPWQAFADFIRYAKENSIKTGNDVAMAKRDADGYRGRSLGVRRIERILNHYAPGRYEFREVVILHDEK